MEKYFVMKKVVIILVLFLMNVFIVSADETRDALPEKKYYENKQLKSEWQMLEDLLIYKEYSKDGKLFMSRMYKKGKRDEGVVKTFYLDSGALRAEGLFRNNQLDGKTTGYYPTGELRVIVHYLNGVRHGLYKEFYLNRKLAEVKKYDNGVVNGKWQSYFENGKSRHRSVYVKGKPKGVFVVLYPNGKTKFIEKRKNFKLLSRTAFDGQGQVVYEKNFEK